MNNNLITLLIELVVIGLILYLIEAYTPLDGAIKTIIRVVAIIIAIVLVLSAFGIMSGGHSILR